MSEVEQNMNQEALDAQEAYDVEQQQQQQMGTTTQQTVQEQSQKPRVREGWTTQDGEFFTFKNYDNLPAEYKTFLPRKQTKSKTRPDGAETVVHVDPFDGKTYRYGVTLFDNGGSSVWSRFVDPNKPQGGGSGSGSKSFYLDVGCTEYSINEANALLAANESDRVYRYKPHGEAYEVERKTTKDEAGNVVVISKHRLLLLKQKRITF